MNVDGLSWGKNGLGAADDSIRNSSRKSITPDFYPLVVTAADHLQATVDQHHHEIQKRWYQSVHPMNK